MKRMQRRLLAAVVGLVGVAVLAGTGSAGASTKTFVGCGSKVSTNVTLASDLTCVETDGLQVNADGITINLNGHTLTDGDGGGDRRTGIDVGGHSNVTIRNGTIANFGFGIVTDEDPNLSVQNMTILLDGENECDYSQV